MAHIVAIKNTLTTLQIGICLIIASFFYLINRFQAILVQSIQEFPQITIIQPDKHFVDMKYEMNEHIIEYLNFTSDTINASIHKECGRVWLYHNKGLILSIYSITNDTIYIKNINPMILHCNPTRITIYATIHGIELLGGLATPYLNRCEWKYSFNITIPGKYKIMARLLYYDGDIDADYKKCETQSGVIFYNETTTLINADGVYLDNSHILQRIQSQKFYSEQEQCCEWCSRLENCAFYLSQDTYHQRRKNIDENRCIMFNWTAMDTMQLINVYKFSNISIATAKNWNANYWIAGKQRNEETKYYLGALQATTPTQNDYCRRTNFDLIHNSHQLGQFKLLQSNFNHNKKKQVCRYDNIHRFGGRWIKQNKNANLNQYKNKQCRKKEWFCNVPAIYVPYDCEWRYNDTVQILLDLYHLNGIHKITFIGDSIINQMFDTMNGLLSDNLLIRLENVKWDKFERFLFHDMRINGINAAVESKNVFITNLELVHRLWHDTIAEVEQFLNKTANLFETYFIVRYGEDSNNWPALVIVELPLIISEREYHCTAPRVVKINKLLHHYFANQGHYEYKWNILPLEALTAAMQYKYSLLQDGLHPSAFVTVDIIRIMLEMLLNI